MELWPLLRIQRRTREQLAQAGESLLRTKTHNFQIISFTDLLCIVLHFSILKLTRYKASSGLQIVLCIKFSLYITKDTFCFHWKDQFKTIFLAFFSHASLSWGDFLS